MGITLQKTAIPTNVKERLDFSCAIFTTAGDLVVNAPHIPVHLGAMGQTVRAVHLPTIPNMQPGDVFVTNDPYRGGSHLPDVTVVTPVHDARPANCSSSPPAGHTTRKSAESRRIDAAVLEEPRRRRRADSQFQTDRSSTAGRVAHRRSTSDTPLRTTRRGTSQLLTSGPIPRAADDNLADIAAQVAANRQGGAICSR